MDRIAALFRMIKDTDEKDEEFLQEAYTYPSFLMSRHIKDKIGKKINKGNTLRRMTKKKGKESRI
jgi:hypothetical protein